MAQQATQRIKVYPVDNYTPYYTLQIRENHILTARNQVLQVISGAAWVSNNGQDYTLKAGEAITLKVGGDGMVVVSAMFKKPVRYTLSS